MAIHAIDMDHPPGMGMPPDILPALRIVRTHAVMATAAASDSDSQVSRVIISRGGPSPRSSPLRLRGPFAPRRSRLIVPTRPLAPLLAASLAGPLRPAPLAAHRSYEAPRPAPRRFAAHRSYEFSSGGRSRSIDRAARSGA